MPVILSDDEYADFVQLRRWYKNIRGPGVSNRTFMGPTIVQPQQAAPRRVAQRRAGSAGLFPVDLTVTAGTASLIGSKVTTAGFQYTATKRDGTSPADDYDTDLTPVAPRDNGKRIAATKGQGYIDSDGNFVLEIAYERRSTGGC